MSETIKKMKAARVPKVKKADVAIVHEDSPSDEVVVAQPTVKTMKVRKPRKKKNEVMALVDSSDDSVEETKSGGEAAPSSSPKKKPPNNWIDHVKSFREAHPEVSYKDALKQAKETYKK